MTYYTWSYIKGALYAATSADPHASAAIAVALLFIAAGWKYALTLRR